MKLLSLVLLAYLWSCQLITAMAAEAYPPTFQIISGDFTDEKGSVIEIPNMPRLRSQDSLPICIGISAATIAQKFVCDQKTKEYPDCSQIPPAKEISPFSMISWAKPTDEKGDPFSYQNHKNITLGNLSGAAALMHSAKLFSFMPESCYPLDQIANTYADKNKKEVDAILEELTKIYKDNRTKTEADIAAKPCDNCPSPLEKINNSLATAASAREIHEALQANSFPEFMYAVIHEKCDRLRLNPKPLFNYFPKEEDNITNGLDLLPKIKEILQKTIPLQIGNVCFLRDPDNKCKGAHSFVISGYKRVCSTTSKNCKELFKVQNSWGKDWQNENNDGWVDAESILKNVTNTPKINTGTLSWLTAN